MISGHMASKKSLRDMNIARKRLLKRSENNTLSIKDENEVE